MKNVLVGLGLLGLFGGITLTNAQDSGADLGASTYASCAGCHGAEGEGVPGTFPPHAGHLPNVVAKEGGRSYLINVLLYGLSGEIQVLGETYSGAMPAWGSLSDEAIAAVINHELTAWGNAELLPEDFAFITAEEVAAERGKDLDQVAVLELRTALELSGDE